MADLFLSYSSHDRPWAAQLFDDLRVRFPNVKLFWDQDRASLPKGEPFRTALKEAAKASTHFVALWSQKAKDSQEVGPEIQAFDQHQSDHSEINDARRRLFWIPLDASEYGFLKDVQGLPAIRDHKLYDPAVEDRGVAKVSQEPWRTRWIDLVDEIGTSIEEAERRTLVTLAVLAMDVKMTSGLDAFLDERTVPGPTLNELLKAHDISLDVVKKRYHENALHWQPFATERPGGTERTILELMRNLRVVVNANLSHQPEYGFQWQPRDLLDEIRKTKNEAQLQKVLDSHLGMGPAVLVIDLITLYHPVGAKVFSLLADYAKKDQTVFVSLSPSWQPAAEIRFQSLRSVGRSVLKDYFLPNIPASGIFAPCGLNVLDPLEIERLVRGSLGVFHRERSRAQAKNLASAAP